MRFSVVIPALNEEAGIVRAIRDVNDVFTTIGEPFEIIVVDDGSTDGTVANVQAEQSQGMPVRLLQHDINRGKGAAVKTGTLAASGEWVLMLDTDLSVAPETFRSFLPHLDSTDLLIGSRRVTGADIAVAQPWHRDLSGRLFNVFIRAFLQLPYHDTQCGFKAFHQRTRKLFESLEATGWAFDVELLMRARHDGFRIQELPVTWRHGELSRVRFAHSGAIARELLRMRRFI